MVNLNYIGSLSFQRLFVQQLILTLYGINFSIPTHISSHLSSHIVWGDDTHYWKCTTVPDSRFPEVAFLHFVFWFEIRGKINKLALSKNTRYAAYLVFKMSCSVGFKNTPVELSVGVEGCLQNTKKAYLHPDVEYKMYRRELRRGHNNVRSFHNRLVGLSFPSGRSDGWLEIEMGEFFNSGLENEEIHMSVMEINCGNIKRRFFLEGIEVKP
ncbi:hypothetical protein QL285_092297 [Trifolium repens]|nr:hypothetical protein QL285_092297 [Trifolium repens]